MEPARGGESLGRALRSGEPTVPSHSLRFLPVLQFVCLQMSVQVSAGQRSTSDVCLGLPPPDVLRPGLSQDPEIACSDRVLTSQFQGLILASQSWLTDQHYRCGFYIGLQSLIRSKRKRE